MRKAVIALALVLGAGLTSGSALADPHHHGYKHHAKHHGKHLRHGYRHADRYPTHRYVERRYVVVPEVRYHPYPHGDHVHYRGCDHPADYDPHYRELHYGYDPYYRERHRAGIYIGTDGFGLSFRSGY